MYINILKYIYIYNILFKIYIIVIMSTSLAEVSSHWPILSCQISMQPMDFLLGYFVHLESKYRLNDNISQCCADANGFPSFGGFVRCAAEAVLIIPDAGG